MPAEMINPAPAPIYSGVGKARPTERVRLVHVETGEVIEAWPIDAREHVAAGDYLPEEAYLARVAAPAEEAPLVVPPAVDAPAVETETPAPVVEEIPETPTETEKPAEKPAAGNRSTNRRAQ